MDRDPRGFQRLSPSKIGLNHGGLETTESEGKLKRVLNSRPRSVSRFAKRFFPERGERRTRKLNEQEVGAKMKSFLDLLKCNGREGRK